MGLFSLFEKEQIPEKTLEYYLNQRSTKSLIKAGEAGMCTCNASYDSDYAWAKINCENKLKSVYSYLDETGTEEIPKYYMKQNIKPSIFFKIASDKGSGLASFYLALFYENGICVEKDQGIANNYYDKANFADEPASNFIEILKKAKDDMWFVRDWTEDQNETLAIDLWFANDSEWRRKFASYGDLIEKLDDIERKKYLLITSYLLWFYAENNGVWARGCLGQALINHKSYMDKGMIHALGFWGNWTTEQEIGKKMLMTIVKDAKTGNQFALNYCKSNNMYDLV